MKQFIILMGDDVNWLGVVSEVRLIPGVEEAYAVSNALHITLEDGVDEEVMVPLIESLQEIHKLGPRS